MLAHDLGYFPKGVYDSLAGMVTEVKRMLSAFLRRVNQGH